MTVDYSEYLLKNSLVVVKIYYLWRILDLLGAHTNQPGIVSQISKKLRKKFVSGLSLNQI